MTMSSRNGARRLWRGFALATPLCLLFVLGSATAFAQSFSIADVSIAEADVGGILQFTVSLDQDPGVNTYTVDYTTSDATATTAGSDYTLTADTLTFTSGITSLTLDVPIADDGTDEVDETFVVTLSNATGGASIASSQAAGTILDDDGPNITVTDATVAEAGTAQFFVQLSAVSPQVVTVDYATADVSATAGADYTAVSTTTLTFSAGITAQIVDIVTLTDAIDEGVSGTVDSETFSVVLGNADNGTITSGTGTGTITDDDEPPAVSFAADVTAAETDGAATTDFVFTVDLAAASEKDITVTYLVNDGTASDADADYVDLDDDVTPVDLAFAAGVTSQTITVVVNGDDTDEDDETFTVDLQSAVTDLGTAIDSTPVLSDSQGVGTVQNDDADPAISVDDISIAEADSGSPSGTFTVSLSNPSDTAITVDYETADGTATTGGSDYTQITSTTLTYAAGETSKSVVVTVAGDTVFENGGVDEAFTLDLSNALGGRVDAFSGSGVTIAAAQGTATITDTDAEPTVSIGDVTANENGGVFDLTVTLSNAADQDTTVSYSTADGTATTADSDYTTASGTATVAADATTTTITVTVTGDLKNESDETFTVVLTDDAQLADANALVITDDTGLGTITNDDGVPTVSIADVTEAENLDGTISLTVSLTALSDQDINVDYTTATTPGTATAGVDFTAAAGTLTIAAGSSDGTVDVLVTGDTVNEADETLIVTLSNAELADTTSLTITDAEGTGTIDNDDVVVVGIDDVTEDENLDGSFDFTVSILSGVTSDQDVTFTVGTADGTALSASDYTATPTTGTSGTITAGQTTYTVSVAVSGDTSDEDDETFTADLSVLGGGSDATPTFEGAGGTESGTGTITNDDTAPTVSIADPVASDEGTTLTFAVTLDAASGRTVTVDYVTSDGTAAAGSDFTTASGTLTFNAGNTTATANLDVALTDDALDEEDTEAFTVTISNPSNATLGTSSATGTINDNDALPGMSVSDAGTVTEGADLTFTISLDAASGRAVSATYTVTDGSGTAGTDTGTAADDDGNADSDGNDNTGVADFPAGVTAVVVTVPTTDDTIDEVAAAPETLTLELSAHSNATNTDGSGSASLTDNDATPSMTIDDVTDLEDTGTFLFTVTLDHASDSTITVDYDINNGTATTADSDYTDDSGTLTFSAGDLTKTVTVAVTTDAKDEPDPAETFTVDLSSETGTVTVTDAQGAGAITDDDDAPTLSVADVTVAEDGNAVFTINLSASSGSTITVDYVATAGTATAGGTDFDETTVTDDDASTADGIATFTSGDTAVIVTVDTTADTLDEGGADDYERFTLVLGAVTLTNATLDAGSDLGNVVDDSTATATITDDDLPPNITIDDVTEAENADGFFDFTITLDAASGNTVTVDYSLADGTATTTDGDYTSTAKEDDDTDASDAGDGDGTATFAAGATTIQLRALVTGDTTDEATETFNVNLANASFGTITDGTGVGTITTDDTAPTISIDDIAITEGDSGDVAGTVTVTLSNASDSTIAMTVALADDTATSADTDYSGTFTTSDASPSDATLTFVAGETSHTISVAATGDDKNEASETFDVELSSASGGTNGTVAFAVAGGTTGPETGVVTVTNDDAVVLSIAAASEPENQDGTLTFAVTIDASTGTATTSGADVTFNVTTSAGTATAGGTDYTTVPSSGATGTISADGTSTNVTVAVTGDTINEDDETFTVTLDTPGGGLDATPTLNGAATSATGTIENDDVLALVISDDTSTDESDGTLTFTVELETGAGMTSDADVSVDYTLTDGTAYVGASPSGVGGSDYTAVGTDDDGGTAGTLTIEAGTFDGTIMVAFADDSINEADETFTVVLTNLTGGSGTGNDFSDATGLGTILDDDVPTISIADNSATEGTDIDFTVTTTSASDVDLTLGTVGTTAVSATQDTDYPTTSAEPFTIPAGDTTATFTVQTTADSINEADETFTVTLFTAGGGQRSVVAIAGAGGNDATGTITNDDSLSITIDSPTAVTEGATGADPTITFTVDIGNPTDADVTVNVITAGDTATEGTDYVASSTTPLTITGDGVTTTGTVTVTVTSDDAYEGGVGASEQFFVNLTDPGSLGGNVAGTGTVSITDAQGVGTIDDDDAAPEITVSAGTGTEAGDITFTFSVDKTPETGFDAVVDWAAADDTSPSALSTANQDYTANTGTVTFTNGGAGADQDITISSSADTIDEVDETFTLTLDGTSLSDATFAGGSTTDVEATGTITDDDAAPEIEIADVTIAENGGSVTLTVGINSGAGVATTASAKGITADYVLSEGTATSATGEADYTAASAADDDGSNDGIATFADETVTSVDITIPIVDDGTDESATETFTVTIGGVTLTNATLEDSNNVANATSADVATVSITDDDAVPTVSVADVGTTEDAGTTMDFVITLSNPSELTPSIDWRLADVTTTADSDFTDASANAVTYSETETTKTISITVIDDTTDETASETYTFEVDRNDANLSGGSIGSFDVATATGTITDDDAAPTITVSDATFDEADGATTYTGTEILLSHASDLDITVDYVVNDGSGSATFNAVDTEDYTDTSGTLTFTAGTLVPAVDLAITIDQDTKDENAESFDIVFSNIQGGVATSTETFATDGTAAITITDDDDPPTVSVAAVTQAEAGGNAVFTATLTAISGKTVTLQIDTADGDSNAATAGADYTAIVGSTVTFGADSDLTKSFSVVVADDAIDEEDQEYKVVGSSFTNTSESVGGDATAVGTITDDDAAPLVYITDVTQAETEASQSFTFTAALDNSANGGSNPGVSEKTVTVDYATSAGDTEPATAGSDYTAIGTTELTIAAAASSNTIDVTVAGDTTDEPDQEFKVTLSNAANATLDTNDDLSNASGADNIAVGTITDNDASPTISVDDITILEATAGAGGTVTGDFAVSISEASEFDVSVDVDTSTADATSGVDFDAIVGTTVTITAGDGDNTEAVTVTVNGDTVDEANQTFELDLTNPVTTGSTPVISDAQGVATITDDDPAPTISIDDITVLESAAGPSGTVPGTFAVTLDAASEQIVTVDFAAASGASTGADVADFDVTSGTVTFTAGDVAEAVAVTVNGDAVDEEDQTVDVTLTNAASASGDTPAISGDAIGTLTITDDDPAPSITIADVSQAEGESGTSTFDFTISIDAASEKTVAVDYAVSDGTAVDSDAVSLAAGGDDYDAASGTTLVDDDSTPGDDTATFDPLTADTSVVVSVTVNGDETYEGDETFTVDLSGESNGTLSGAQGVGTITGADDAEPTISIDDQTSVDEDETLAFSATLSNPSSSAITVDYTTTDGTGTAGADYTTSAASLTFSAGATAPDSGISVTLTDDSVYEGDETFTVDLSNASGGIVISDAQGDATITEDEPLPTLSIDDVTVAEGDSGTATFTFTITASAPTTSDMTVVHTVTDGTAVDASTAGPGDGTDDFDFTSGTATITGDGVSTTTTVTVTANGDTFFEEDETFTVDLSNALLNGVTSLTISDASGLGTITNEDPAPTITMADPTAVSESAGSVVFTVTLSQAVGADVSVDYALIDGSAVAADGGSGPEDGTLDYGAVTDDDSSTTDGTLVIEQGTTTGDITVVINSDSEIENDETFVLQLSSPNGVSWTGYPIITTLEALATIDNDDNSTISITDPTAVTEGDSGTTAMVFTVTQTPANVADATVDYTTSDATASDAGDYTLTSGTLTFLAGITTRTISVPILGDTVDEGTGDETFTLTLSNVFNSTLDGATDPITATGTITDDDDVPTITIGDVTIAEGDSGVVQDTLTVSLSHGTEVGDVTVTANSADDTATQLSDDYEAVSGLVVTIAASTPGVVNTTATVTVDVNGDSTDEVDETFDVVLTGASDTVNSLAFTASDDTGTATITDDDDPPVASVADVSVTEGADGATATATFTVTLTPASGKAVSVDYVTADVTANDGVGDAGVAVTDYTATTGTVTFAVGENDKQFTVDIAGDDTDEVDGETYTVTLSATTGFESTVDTTGGTATGTITDDDAAPTISIGTTATAAQTVDEGASGTTAATFTVSLDHASDQDITVNYVTADATAVEAGSAAAGGDDYVAIASTPLTVTAGTTSTTLDVTVNGDATDEATETYSVVISGEAGGAQGTLEGTGVTLGTDTATGTITTDDTAPTISISGPSDTAETGDPTVAFTVTLSNTSDSTINVDFATADGVDGTTTLNATGGSDYTAQSGTVTFAAGSSSDAVTIAVPLTDDITDEEDQSFTVDLTDNGTPGGTNGTASISGASASATILDDDDPPTMDIAGPGSVAEGDSGTTSFDFTVTLDAPSEKTVTAQYDSSDGTADSAGSDATIGDLDFTAAAVQTVTFVALDTSETVSVLVNGDDTEEGDDTFDVVLSVLSNATSGTLTDTATITDDDPTPTISVDDAAAATEGADLATDTQTFTVSLSNPTALNTVTVTAATTDSTATDENTDGDFDAVSTLLSYAVGETSKSVDVTINGDDKDEGDAESYSLTLSGPTNASILDGSGLGVITDDDDPPVITIDSPTAVDEGADGDPAGAIDFTVTLSNPSAFTVTAAYTTTDGADGDTTLNATSSNAGAAGDADYNAAAGTVSFDPEVLTQTISVAINGDDVDEGASQSFSVDLSSPANSTIGTASGTGTITDEEATPTVDIADVTVALEGGSGVPQSASPVLTLSGESEFTLTVDYATSDGTATTADGDYTAGGATVTFVGGDTSETIDVTVDGDDKDEDDETVTVTLSSHSTNLDAGDSTATITITDDDLPPTVSVSDEVLVAEDAALTTTDMTFTVSLDAESGKTITMDYATADGTATLADGDYSSASASLTFSPGDTSKSVVVTANGDDKDEDDESFSLDVSNIVNGLNDPATASGTGTITNDDVPPTMSIADALVTENEAGTTVDVTVSLSGASGREITVSYATSDDTATSADGDYTPDGPTTLTYASGETLKTITLAIGGDTKDEPDESFDVTLSGETNATITDALVDGVAVVTINDNDAPPTVSVADIAVDEGTTGATATATVTATLSEVSGKDITVQIDTADGTATTADSDYTAVTAGSITILAGAADGTADIDVIGDVTDEGDSEAFTATISGGTNVTVDAADTATVTITDDDDPPVISIADVSVDEGDDGAASAAVAVTFSNPSASTVDVNYVTGDGTATTADSDYTSVSSTTLSFAPGVVTQDITVDATGDTTDEVDEAFTVTLSGPVNGTLDPGTDNAAGANHIGTVTITNDDTPPVISVGDPTAAEEDTVGSIEFTVTLTNASSSAVTVDFVTADGTAESDGAAAAGGSDYTTTSGTLTIPAGTTSDSTTIAVPVTSDTTDESDETFTVTLSAPAGGSSGAPTLDGAATTATATITDDDIAPLVSLADISVDEDDAISASGTVTATLSNTSDQTVTVAYATADGTAKTAGDDYTTGGGTVTFSAGATSQTFDVSVRGDFKDEDDETFTVGLSSPTNATVDTAADNGNAVDNSTATVTIVDNDPVPTVSISDPISQSEPSSAKVVNFAVTLSAASGRSVSVDYATADGTAEDENLDGDYDAAAGTLTFAEGLTSLSIPVTVNPDSKDEDDETFTVVLSGEVNATLDTATGEYTIADNDAEPSLSIDSPTVVEDDPAGAATFTATLGAASGRIVTVGYTTADDTAVAPGDYTATAGTLTFAPGEVSQTFDVPVVADALDEDDESLTLTLTDGVNVQLASSSATATITDDDDAPNLSVGDITVTEGSSLEAVSPTSASFVFTLDAASGKDVAVDYATADGSAEDENGGGDYEAASGTLTIAAGALTGSVDVSVSADYDDEPDETFVVAVSSVTNATATALSATATIADDDEPPLTVTAPSSASDGQDVTVSAEIILPISSVTGATLYHSEGGDASFDVVTFTNTTGNTWTADISGTSVTMRGLVWYVEVTDDLDAGRTFNENTFSTPGYIPVNGSVDMSLATMTTSPNIWNVVGPPVSPDSTSMASTFDNGDGGFITEWFGWRWNAGTQEWEVPESLGDSTPVSTDGFETGKGWFVAVIGDGAAETRSVTGQSVDPTTRYALPLSSGWNLLANPFNFSVAWSDSTIRASVGNSEASPTFHLLNSNGAVDNRLIYLDTSTQTSVTRLSSETSDPYSVPAGQAFWFLSNQSGELLIPATETVAAPGGPLAPTAVKPKGDWRVFVNAASEFGSDQAQAIAARDTKSAGSGSLSYVKAPSFPGSKVPRVTLVNPEANGAMARLNSDVQSVGDEMVWLVDIANGDGAVLSWRTVDVPADYDLQLVDLTSERTIDLRRDAQLRLEGSGFDSRQYALKAIKRYIPDVTRLLPNYPNPFNPETWIPFELAEESEVSIAIYGLRGEVVRRLELGRMREGGYVTREQAAHWDGRNALGEQVASGVYVYEIKAGSHIERRRLVVLK
ncbi:hypothetical protein HN371_13790 [Candidatus Poribacteria bacterium]|nr:hypothetical protein [Candidatus Poribacteria bacterium]